MDVDFVKAFAMTLGAIVGIPTLLYVGRAAITIGRKWGDIEAAQLASKDAHATTSRVVTEIRDAVREMADTVNPRLQRIEFILSGADGENGLRSDVRDVRQRVGVLEQRVGPPDRRKKSRPVATDRRRKSA